MILQMLTKVQVYLASLNLQREEGQGFVEYGLIVALIVVVVVATFALIGPKIDAAFQSVVDAMP